MSNLEKLTIFVIFIAIAVVIMLEYDAHGTHSAGIGILIGLFFFAPIVVLLIIAGALKNKRDQQKRSK